MSSRRAQLSKIIREPSYAPSTEAEKNYVSREKAKGGATLCGGNGEETAVAERMEKLENVDATDNRKEGGRGCAWGPRVRTLKLKKKGSDRRFDQGERPSRKSVS